MERKINEEFKHRRIILKVVEGEGCKGCHFDDGDNCVDFTNNGGNCAYDYRTDKKSVKFIKVEKP